MRRLIVFLLPASFFYADNYLTVSAKRLLVRLSVVVSAMCACAVAAGLLTVTNWRDVAAGALLAWFVSLVVWAITSYRSEHEEDSKFLTALAERDLLHARFNHLAAQLGAPLVNVVDGQLQDVLAVRKERHAHLSGLEEFSASAGERGHDWWDNTAVGAPGEPT